MAKGIGYGKIEKVDGEPAIPDFLQLNPPDWAGKHFVIGFDADMRAEVPADFFPERQDDPSYRQRLSRLALEKLIPDAIDQIHGRLREDRAPVIAPAADIGARYRARENKVHLGPDGEREGRLIRPTFHYLTGVLEVKSDQARRWNEILSGAAEKIAALLSEAAMEALRHHPGGEGEGPNIPVLLTRSARKGSESAEGSPQADPLTYLQFQTYEELAAWAAAQAAPGKRTR